MPKTVFKYSQQQGLAELLAVFKFGNASSNMAAGRLSMTRIVTRFDWRLKTQRTQAHVPPTFIFAFRLSSLI